MTSYAVAVLLYVLADDDTHGCLYFVAILSVSYTHLTLPTIYSV